ncbi:MAG: Uncharacterised protein [Methanobacteriota archaeon]|jgi:hypothetical protein|nr:MAG: Uncharacterised protein [Euryarchaeota archaeon]|tara:strand:- start:271 stop:471 length:201 start_codon:yes stop_codon:yes gene_type:complete
MNEKNMIEELLKAMTMLMKTFSQNLNIENEIGKLRLNDWMKEEKKSKGFDMDEEIDWPNDFEEEWE